MVAHALVRCGVDLDGGCDEVDDDDGDGCDGSVGGTLSDGKSCMQSFITTLRASPPWGLSRSIWGLSRYTWDLSRFTQELSSST